MKPNKIIHIKGLEYIDLLRTLYNLGYTNKPKKKDFILMFANEYSRKSWKWCPSDNIVLKIYNPKILQEKEIKIMLLEYLL